MLPLARPLPRLIAITDLHQFPAPVLVRRASDLLAAAMPGSVAVLLRDHDASARRRLLLGRELRDLSRATGQELWVADRLDLALALAADGVHLGERSVTARDARALLGETYRLSRAWHALTWGEIELVGVDALLLSPVLQPRKGRAPCGLAGVGALSKSLCDAASGAALFALGGVTAATAADCLLAGARGVAAIGAAWGAEPEALLRALGIRRSSR